MSHHRLRRFPRQGCAKNLPPFLATACISQSSSAPGTGARTHSRILSSSACSPATSPPSPSRRHSCPPASSAIRQSCVRRPRASAVSTTHQLLRKLLCAAPATYFVGLESQLSFFPVSHIRKPLRKLHTKAMCMQACPPIGEHKMHTQDKAGGRLEGTRGLPQS